MLLGTLPASKMTVSLQRPPIPIVSLRTWGKMQNNKPSARLSDSAICEKCFSILIGLCVKPALINCHIKGKHL